VPAVVPVSAALVVGSNLGTFRAAWEDVRGGRLGLPALYTAITAATLATGQFVSCALMSWLFKYWHDRYRRDLATERHRLLDGLVPLPALVRLAPGRDDGDDNDNGAAVLVATGRLRPADVVSVAA